MPFIESLGGSCRHIRAGDFEAQRNTQRRRAIIFRSGGVVRSEQIPDQRPRRDQQHAHDDAAADAVKRLQLRYALNFCIALWAVPLSTAEQTSQTTTVRIITFYARP